VIHCGSFPEILPEVNGKILPIKLREMFSTMSFLKLNPPILCEVIKSEKYLNAYRIPDKEFRNLVGGMKFRDLKYGDGSVVKHGDIVNMQFTGKLMGGREIESTSHLPGSVIQVTAGGSEVVKAVCEGIIGMKEYGSRELLVPPSMHYPERFPNQIMIYEVMVRTLVRNS
jgi:FKBP-type peptidyl-prolyl cis-trans isomerase